MKKVSVVYLFLIFGISVGLNAQDLIVNGKVFNSRNKVPLENITVKIVNQKKEVMTQKDGSFSLTARKGQSLVFTSINMITKYIKIENSIEKINNISGYTYERIDTGNVESGLLAQEVIGILPEVVEFNKNTNHYNISYGNMAGLFVEYIKALNDKINMLTERISFLEKK